MKQNIILLLALVGSMNVSAQKSFYIGLQAGYGLNFGGQTNYNYTQDNSTNNNTITYKSNPLNLGAGFLPAIGAGYYFNQNLGVELSTGYLSGNNYTATQTYINSTEHYNSQYSFSTFYVNPSLIFRSKIGKIQPYAKFGLFLGLLNKATINIDYNYSSNSSASNILTIDGKNGLPIGFTTSLGVEFAAGNHFGIYGELFGRFASYAPSSYSKTTSSSTSTVTGEYKDEVIMNFNSTTDLPSVSYPINAVGLNVGVRYYFKGNN